MTLINDLESFSDSDLETELKRREKQETKPKPRCESWIDDLKPIVAICKLYIDSLHGGEYFKDHEHYIFEVAMDLVYGKQVWNWIRENENE